MDDDDDEVIEVPSEEPTITEIPDDDDEETPEPAVKEVVIDEDTSSSVQAVNETSQPSAATEPHPEVDGVATSSEEPATPTVTVATKPIADPIEENATYEPVGNESDIQILVPQISVLDLDDFEEKLLDSGTVMDDTPQAPIKIKEEPKDDGYDDEDDGFEEVGTFELDDNDETQIICKSFSFSSCTKCVGKIEIYLTKKKICFFI